jgi:hypothetical protein
MLELEKVEKFKFDGKEYTLKELRTLLAKEKEQQRDYTAKMQKLAEERKSWETQRKETQRFDDNLYADLQAVKDNPQLAQEFLKVYPQSYHRHLRAVLESTSTSQPQGTPQVPVDCYRKFNSSMTMFKSKKSLKLKWRLNVISLKL